LQQAATKLPVVEPAKARSLCFTAAKISEDDSSCHSIFCGALWLSCNIAGKWLVHQVRELKVIDNDLSPAEREQGVRFAPVFDAAGLLTAVAVDAATDRVLVVAHMNREALDRTIASGKVNFWSRSRQCLWLKGETSGNILKVAEILVDCDQDALVIRAIPAGPTCHTGAVSCFYRRLEQGDDGSPALVKVNT
jgi:phosphoribosyl-AMP cyclohydrolase